MTIACARTLLALMLSVSILAVTGCDGDDDRTQSGVERLFPTDDNPVQPYSNCLFTSPKWYESGDDNWIIVSRAAGKIEGIDPNTGQTDWSVELPQPDTGVPYLLATPAIVGDKLIAAYHAIDSDYGDYRGPNDQRLAHLVAVVDLDEQRVDPSFPVVELEAEVESNEDGETTEFLPGQALTRPRVVHAGTDGDLGRVYLGQGNTRDIQPWHGWAWEIDLDDWRDDGAQAAITSVLNTTPEPAENCGEHGQPGSRQRQCGGGLWAPSGHLVVEEDDDSYHLILAPGNGQLDLNRDDYANTLMKVEPGLDFDPGCDDDACADFDPDAPSTACMESCENLFIPRLLPDQQLQRAPDGRCDDLDTLFECWGEMDYIGGSTPVDIEVDDHNLLVYPTKDGHAYLVDADHLGTMYDRHRMVEMCGHNGGDCSRIWAGMSVTKPLRTEIDGRPAVLIPTFMPDNTNPAGLVALQIEEVDGEPKLEQVWEYPDFEDNRAVQRFRNHPSRVAMGADGQYAWIVDIESPSGRLTGVRIDDGEPVYSTRLEDPGRRYTLPLVRDDRLYVSSCHRNAGPGQLEGYRLTE